MKKVSSNKCVRLMFSNSHGIVSWLVRKTTWSKWSHVSVVCGDTVLEAVKGKGVVETPIEQVFKEISEYAYMDVPCDNPEEVIQKVRSQLGKPYDTTAVIGIFFNRNWEEPDSWFCSELVAWAFQQAGLMLFKPSLLNRITPQHIWMLDMDN